MSDKRLSKTLTKVDQCQQEHLKGGIIRPSSAGNKIKAKITKIRTSIYSAGDLELGPTKLGFELI
jgi:hypothetical protein